MEDRKRFTEEAINSIIDNYKNECEEKISKLKYLAGVYNKIIDKLPDCFTIRLYNGRPYLDITRYTDKESSFADLVYAVQELKEITSTVPERIAYDNIIKYMFECAYNSENNYHAEIVVYFVTNESNCKIETEKIERTVVETKIKISDECLSDLDKAIESQE